MYQYNGTISRTRATTCSPSRSTSRRSSARTSGRRSDGSSRAPSSCSPLKVASRARALAHRLALALALPPRPPPRPRPRAVPTPLASAATPPGRRAARVVAGRRDGPVVRIWLLLGVAVFLVIQTTTRSDPRHHDYLIINLGLTLGFELLTIIVWYVVRGLPEGREPLVPVDRLGEYWGASRCRCSRANSATRRSSLAALDVARHARPLLRLRGRARRRRAAARRRHVARYHEQGGRPQRLAARIPDRPVPCDRVRSGFNFCSVRIAFVHSRLEDSTTTATGRPDAARTGCTGASPRQCSVPAASSVTCPRSRWSPAPSPTAPPAGAWRR